jgi:hypothetical protein
VIGSLTSQAAFFVFLSAATGTRVIAAYSVTHRASDPSPSCGFFDSFVLLLFF